MKPESIAVIVALCLLALLFLALLFLAGSFVALIAGHTLGFIPSM